MRNAALDRWNDRAVLYEFQMKNRMVLGRSPGSGGILNVRQHKWSCLLDPEGSSLTRPVIVI